MTTPKPPSEREEQQEQDDEQQKQEKWYERTRYQILLFAVGIALFVLVGGLILDWYIAPQTSTQKKDLVQALGLLTAGAAGAVGIYFTWRGQSQARRAQEENQRTTLEQLEQSRNELDITRRGQITERFTQAIDQIGSESPEIRLGAIYSLERTAREDRDFHWPIMEVLTTYVRTHRPWNALWSQEAKAVHQQDLPAPDIQAILTVIGRRSIYHTDVEYGPIDLHQTDLSGTDLSGANLSKANLFEANLRTAFLSRADLSGANLSGALLWPVDLSEANLSGADLRGAKLVQVHLDEAIGDQNTKLPPDLTPPAHWSVKTDEQTEGD